MSDAPAPTVPSDSAVFALALAGMDGVGRVTIGRLLAAFGGYDALLRYPREQVLARIKGVGKAQELVGRLFDEAAMRERLSEAREQARELAAKRVDLVAPGDPTWPEPLAALPRGLRPSLLYAYGRSELLQVPLVAFHARPPLTEAGFERAQALVRHVLAAGLVPAAGMAQGFDVVVHKLAGGVGSASVAVLSHGLGRLPGPMRPGATALVRAGGLMVSPFEMSHGPFEHDDREGAHVLAALARCSVFVEPERDGHAWHAMEWALEAGRPVFGLPHPDAPLPDRVHPIADAVDFDWVTAAGGQVRG